MGMGLMDLIAASQGRGVGGGMGMMGMMPQTGAPPVGASVVKALLAKHGITAPANVPGGGDAPPVAPATPAMPPPAPDQPAPVSFDTAPAAPITAPAPPLAAADVSIKKPGMFSRIGDFLKSDDGKAEMMRFAAGAFNGGLGGGLTAATDYGDKLRADRDAATTEAAKMALEGQKINNDYNLGFGHNKIEAFNANATADHYQRSDANQRYGTDSENYRQGRDLGFKQWQHITPSGDTETAQAGENYRHDSASGDAALTQQGENFRHGTPSGDKVLEVREQTAPRINMHAHYTTTPAEYAADGPRLKPSMVQPGGSGGATKIGSDAEYAALPSGARFEGPDGQIRIKP